MKKQICVFTMLALLAFTQSTGAAESNPKSAAGHGKTAVRAAEAGPFNTVFDMAHNEIFSPVKEGPLHYTSFSQMIRDSGETVGVNEAPVTPKRLKGVKTYIIAGPTRSLSAPEVTALKAFVERGGNLLVLLHVSQPVATTTSGFGITVSNFVISERTGLIEGRSQDFHVTMFGAHPVTSGLEKVAVYGTWGLMADDDSLVVASTSGMAWADMDRDREFDAGEPVQEFGIIAVSEYGKGKVVVVADDAPFANQFIDHADNRKLAGNILGWFK